MSRSQIQVMISLQNLVPVHGAGASGVSREHCGITLLIVLSPSDGRRLTTAKVSWYSSSSETGTEECESSSKDENQGQR